MIHEVAPTPEWRAELDAAVANAASELVDCLWRMYQQVGLRHEWRWVLAPASLGLLKREFPPVSQRHNILNLVQDGELQLFGMPVRVDEHAQGPMLELRP